MRSIFLCRLGLILLFAGCATAREVDPVGPIPSERQLQWYEMGYYGFIHFNMNTFTNEEWGKGSESPELFNPRNLDTDQWARVMKEAGMTGIIITAKHHDGFALWPTKTTEHSVQNSPWKKGKGDVIKDLAKSCEKYGLKLGIYLSPWDRNHKDYGKDAYIEDFVTQLTELLSGYGPIFEVWFDGANGGSGYYGGANETRKIDHRTYYQWDRVFDTVRKYQPNAVIFGDNGPDIRWIGNEAGKAGKTNWSIIKREEVYAGSGRHSELQFGHEDGTHFVPAEVDVSIRPGWYYHPAENARVKSLNKLLDIYYQSIGRNASLLLNVPVNTEGRISEKDSAQLYKLKNRLDEVFDEDLATRGAMEASSSVDNYEPAAVIDGDPKTFWMPKEKLEDPYLIFSFDKTQVFNRFLVQEFIAKGQRVKKFRLEAMLDGNWQEIEEQTTIGYKRILRFDALKTKKLKLTILDQKASPLISNIEIFYSPSILSQPVISRNSAGEIEIISGPEAKIFYEVGSEAAPDENSKRYNGSFVHNAPVKITAVSYDPVSGEYSNTSTEFLNQSKSDWQPKLISEDSREKYHRILDENPSTYSVFSIDENICIDLGEIQDLFGFEYLPMSDEPERVVSQYEFYISTDGEKWKKVAEGEFGNIRNNPIAQKVNFEEGRGRYIKFQPVKTLGAGDQYVIGEIGVVSRRKKE